MDSTVTTSARQLPLAPAPSGIAVERDPAAHLVGLLVSAGPDSGQAHEAACYHLSSGGKANRYHLTLRAGLEMGLSDGDAAALAACVELLHNASLVFDDLQDQDSMRRGRPAVWKRFGPSIALCAGALLMSAAYGALGSLSDRRRAAELLSHVHARTTALIAGQSADLTIGDDLSLEQYEAIAAQKSGVLFALPFELVLLYSGRPQAVSSATSIATSVAVGYQISDDIADFVADLGSEGSGPRLNYVILARGRGSVASALASAHTRALDLLETAALDASGLPRACGAPLADFARRLASGLRQDLAIGG